jgi:hypothetical protein
MDQAPWTYWLNVVASIGSLAGLIATAIVFRRTRRFGKTLQAVYAIPRSVEQLREVASRFQTEATLGPAPRLRTRSGFAEALSLIDAITDHVSDVRIARRIKEQRSRLDAILGKDWSDEAAWDAHATVLRIVQTATQYVDTLNLNP